MDKIMKKCSKCGEIKALSEFHKRKPARDGHQYRCKECAVEIATKHRRKIGIPAMTENKRCPAYLGIAVAERLCKHLFKDVVQMPNNNPGYDFICAKDKKIDVKSACLSVRHKYFSWLFMIRKNQTADYFLLLAFNNRDELEPQHQWLIPGNILNHLINTTIAPSTVDKWKKYEHPIGPAITCCNTMKEEDKNDQNRPDR